MVNAFAEASRAAGLTAERSADLLTAMGPDADAIAGALATNHARLGTATRAAVIDALRPANPAFAVEGGQRAAAWLEAQG